MTVYNFAVKQTDGSEKALADYQGKVLLIVNTATGCGFTPQYEGLQKLYEAYQDRGFEVLDFPCNQFKNQAPGTNEEIAEFCQLKYHTTFQTFGKIDVNGENEAPLYSYLKSAQGGLLNKAIKWNFTKFLVDREGNVVKRYASQTKPEAIAEEIEALL
ncbi:glutathione peroxidase [Enterococcus pseudoavium]|uniref:Glutathione peroxidase n=1 Tax=Enterococcus pseudoavium TaxID=44007 RepID=A0ABU3FFE9_9ENTE|nr:glutathione peroxidase [Enterococcus pseudoavium]MDT2755287.1 glutathione peroxidase [Enterococcus pseudoavium]MDT2769763.1 glutathione peroxidase [Enterococcus pseudoavium]